MSSTYSGTALRRMTLYLASLLAEAGDHHLVTTRPEQTED
jgi:hypothetical protein